MWQHHIKYKLVIPSDLAYGNADMQEIPAGSTVIFEVELVKVLKPGELANSAKPLSEEEMKQVHVVSRKRNSRTLVFIYTNWRRR